MKAASTPMAAEKTTDASHTLPVGNVIANDLERYAAMLEQHGRLPGRRSRERRDPDVSYSRWLVAKVLRAHAAVARRTKPARPQGISDGQAARFNGYELALLVYFEHRKDMATNPKARARPAIQRVMTRNRFDESGGLDYSTIAKYYKTYKTQVRSEIGV
jgi:hypothetical protein